MDSSHHEQCAAVTKWKHNSSADGTTQGDFILGINREGFQAIPYILTYQNQQMMVVIEGRKLL